MQSYIKALYDWDIFSEELNFSSSETDTKKANVKVAALEEKLSENIPPELQQRFADFSDAVLSLMSCTERDSFALGFRLCVKLMAEAFADGG